MDRTRPGRRSTLRWPGASLTATIRMAAPLVAAVPREGEA
ncbi:hypothetical protein ACVWXU_002102 [Streptomyces sp. TE33382]